MEKEKQFRPIIRRRDTNTLSHNYCIMAEHSKHYDGKCMCIIKVINHSSIFAPSFAPSL